MRIFGICGKSRGGRSELVAELVARFRLDGLRVAIVKRAPISFDVDSAGTDSYRQRESGCSQILIASDRRLALMEEYPFDSASPELGELVARLQPADIVLAINFRDAEVPRIEVCDGVVTAGERNSRWIVGRVMLTPNPEDRLSLGLEEHEVIAALVLRHALIWRDGKAPDFLKEQALSA